MSKNASIIQGEITWVFRLKPADARLVLAALGGRLRGDQLDDAKRLGDQLAVQRASWADQLADELGTHANKVTS